MKKILTYIVIVLACIGTTFYLLNIINRNSYDSGVYGRITKIEDNPVSTDVGVNDVTVDYKINGVSHTCIDYYNQSYRYAYKVGDRVQLVGNDGSFRDCSIKGGSTEIVYAVISTIFVFIISGLAIWFMNVKIKPPRSALSE